MFGLIQFFICVSIGCLISCFGLARVENVCIGFRSFLTTEKTIIIVGARVIHWLKALEIGIFREW